MQTAIFSLALVTALSVSSSYASAETAESIHDWILNAPIESLSTPRETRFQVLEQKFDLGIEPDPAVFSPKGGWTGRCFRQATPNVSEGMLLLVDDTVTGSNDGPLFPPEKKWVMGFVNDRSGITPADKYDVLDESERQQIESLRKTSAFQSLTVTHEMNSWVSRHGGGNFQFSIRRSEGYWVGRISFINESTAGSVSSPTGSTFGMCYFFAKVL